MRELCRSQDDALAVERVLNALKFVVNLKNTRDIIRLAK